MLVTHLLVVVVAYSLKVNLIASSLFSALAFSSVSLVSLANFLFALIVFSISRLKDSWYDQRYLAYTK